MPILSQTDKVIISSVLSIIAIVLYLVFRGKTRKLCMIAMLLCTAGDFFMTDTFHMGDASTYPGAALFIAAHIVYFICFFGASKSKNYKIRNAGFYSAIVIALVEAAVLSVLAFTVPAKPQIMMYVFVLIYLAVIATNAASQFSYAISEKGQRYFLIAGMTLFILSDFIVFLPLLDVHCEMNDLVWFTYIPAQLLIIFFNDNLPKRGKS